jgi:preprotein translocase subunit SecY
MCIISFTTGTAFIMWQGEQISEHGVGNGMSLIIFMSIVAGMPGAVMSLLNLFGAGEVNIVQILLMVAVMILVIAGVILVITGQRRIPVQYPRQVKGRRLTMGGRNYLPLRVNQAGVIPIIFASAILMLPGTLTEVITQPQVAATLAWLFNPMGVPYMLIYAGLIVFFTFFYTAVTFNPVDMADNLKKQGGVVMGVRPGRATAEYLNHVMTRVTVVGALFLAVVALIPQFILMVFDIGDFMIASYFGGTSLLILVGVALDTVRNVEQHLVMRNYDGFLKGGRAMPGRRR